MTENKESQNVDKEIRSILEGLLKNVAPHFQERTTRIEKKILELLDSAETKKLTPDAVVRVRALLANYLAMSSFNYFAGLCSYLLDTVDSIKAILPLEQKEVLEEELKKRVAEGTSSIDKHIARRLAELFAKDDTSYIG
jgi:hypothetical protein